MKESYTYSPPKLSVGERLQNGNIIMLFLIDISIKCIF